MDDVDIHSLELKFSQLKVVQLLWKVKIKSKYPKN